MSKAKTEFNVSQITEIVLFNHSPAERKKQTSRRDPRLFFVLFNHSPAEEKKQTSRRDPRLFSYMIPMTDINCYFSCKKYLENKSFSRGFMFLLVECMQF